MAIVSRVKLFGALGCVHTGAMHTCNDVVFHVLTIVNCFDRTDSTMRVMLRQMLHCVPLDLSLQVCTRPYCL